jgi:hypothetical protein
MSELSVGSLSGLAANSYVIDVASGSSLDLSNATDLPASALPAGSVLQVVSTNKTNTYTEAVSSGSFSAIIPGLTATITPISATSKILVWGFCDTIDVVRSLALFRDTTQIGLGDAAGSRKQSHSQSAAFVFNFLDSPATTSAITYGVKIQGAAATTVYVNRRSSDTDTGTNARSTSTITLMEIAG